MGIVLTELFQRADYESPLDETVDGFRHSWWITHEFERLDHSDVFLSFTERGNEVARAWLYTTMLSRSYVGLTIGEEEKVRRIDLFEVNESYRRRGIGLQTVDMICDRYSSELVVAFSKDQNTDRFWSRTRLERHDDACPDEYIKSMTMFAYDGRHP